MLPLIERTEYDELVELTGKQTFETPTPDDGLLWQLAIARNSKLRREVDQTGQSFGGRAELGTAFLGDWIRVGVLDRNAVWDASVALSVVPGLERLETPDRSAIFGKLPLFAEAQIADRLALAATLTALRVFAEQAAAGLVSWGSEESHAGVPIVTVSERTSDEQGARDDGLVLRYAVAGEVLIFGLSRAAVVSRIDAALAPRPKAGSPEAAPTQVSLSYARRSA
ncbi:MAG: hypothetical protein EXR76_15785 [Myxococcales bacterium]|nr:hypothetical protein [Myxococcales bacterium]